MFKNEICTRNNVQVLGSGEQTIMLAHGFGCDQRMWRFLSKNLVNDYKLVLFDYVGSGKSDLSQFDKARYSTLDGYAGDIIEICESLALYEVIFIGHSVSSMIGVLASLEKPKLFKQLIMVCPSPCFLNDPPDYMGGFEPEDLEELIKLMDKNYIGWANYLAPLVMGTQNDANLIDELTESFCTTDPSTAKTFAKATFFSDYRQQLQKVRHPTLILQSAEDSLASVDIGKYMHKSIPSSDLEIFQAKGHCLHMTHPDLITPHILNYVR